MGILSLNQFVHRISKTNNNNEVEVTEKVDEEDSTGPYVQEDPVDN